MKSDGRWISQASISMAAPGVSIVIPTWNGIDLLDRFLPSVTTAALQFKCDTGLPIEIIIVDDASEDGTSEWLENKGFVSITSKQPSSPDSSKSESTFTKVAPQAPERIDQGFIRNSTNLGFGKSCNRGVSAATHKLVFLVNNDVELEPDCIQALTLGFSDASVFAVHCRVFNLETELEVGTGKLCAFGRGFLRVHGSYNYSDKSGRGPSLYSAFAGGGASMYNRNYFLALGGFEDLLSPFYWEDVELSYRAWKRGYSVLYEPRSIARHRISSTIRRLPKRKVKRIQQRNRLILHWINVHDGRLLLSHLAWVFVLAVTAPLRLNPGFLLSCLDAARRLPAIIRRRSEERTAAKRSDREILEIFRSHSLRRDITTNGDPRELKGSGALQGSGKVRSSD